MKTEFTHERIIQILLKVKAIDNFKWDENTNLMKIGLSSLQIINFLLKLENEFEIEIEFDEFNYKNLQSLKIFKNYLADTYK